MKKFIIILLFTTFFSAINSISASKLQKLEQLFDLTNDKVTVAKVWDPFFSSANVTDENIKKTAVDKYFENIKKDFIPAYDKFFTETDIDEMLKFHRSPTGKKFLAVSIDLNNEMQNAYSSMVNIIQDVLPKPETAPINLESSNVIHFDDIAKGKNDAETTDLFKKELNQNGLTVVKFSASWCGPCQSYAPEFEKVAANLKEVDSDEEKISVKYIATDIEATKVVAEDNSVVSIPTTIFYKNGQKVDTKTGYINQQALSAKIKELAK